jgi:mono/diheme cytochrome c family protein
MTCLTALIAVPLLLAGAVRAESVPTRKGQGSVSRAASSKSQVPTEAVLTEGKKNAAPIELPTAKEFRLAIQPFLRKNCLECHGADTQSGGVEFESFKDFAGAQAQRKTWEKVRRMLENGVMPPVDHQPRPAEKDVHEVLAWIQRAVFDVDCGQIHDPGHVTIRRLNRAEYNNTIRDLLGVPLRPADDFPSDDVGNGFDNMGDVLSISPLLMEKYLTAADRVTSVALFGVDLSRPPVEQLDNRKLIATDSAHLVRKPYSRERRFVLPSLGSVAGEFNCSLKGEYVFRVIASARQAEHEFAKAEVRVDEHSRQTFDVTGDQAAARYELRLPLAKGKHTFTASFINYLSEPPAPAVPESPSAAAKSKKRGADVKESDREIVFQRFEVEGPFNVDPQDLALGDLETRKRILSATPGIDGTVTECARRILSNFAARAFRRPLAPAEIEPYVNLAAAAAHSDPFDRAIQTGLTAILVSPHFLFRIEQRGTAAEGTEAVPLGPYEMASRLSFFLWSSMPDDELLQLAADGSLARPDVIESQARRMLRDPKSKALVTNFADQWLNLDQLDLAKPSVKVFETFSDRLRVDMKRETELFFGSILREDRSILDLINGRYTFLNERLAKHYNIAGVTGPEFRQVSLEGHPRAGVLTQASILTLTSQRTRTSPVKRGKWIMETLLGTAPPPPPANVPQLADAQKANPKATLREQMALHRKSAACATCHKVMDPLGFGLENFDGIGRWRDKDGDRPVDSTGTLPGGESFRGPIELISVLNKRQDSFRRHVAQTLLTYALGRGLEYYDKCSIDRIVAGAHRGGDRFSAFVSEIVRSEPFTKRRGGGDRNEP